MTRFLKKLYFLVFIFIFWVPRPSLSQSISPANDGTGTTVNTLTESSTQYDIGGGTQSGENLFHSFEQFGLNAGETANFLSNPEISNILGRVVGGDASVINGLLQLTGAQSNLYLMNPAGIIFGQNARLNVPGDFFATTSNGIQLGDEWFSALENNNYTALVSDPSGFTFTADAAGTVLNAGELAVEAGQRIQLVGSTVINTGTLSTPGGDITIQAIPEAGIVSITPKGNLLSLGIPIATQNAVEGTEQPLSALDLPELLTNRSLGGGELGLVVEGDVVQLSRTDVEIPTEMGVAIASGNFSTSSPSSTGGNIDVLGDRVALVSTNMAANGTTGGGSIRVGGGYQGNEIVPNSSLTYVDRETTVDASATLSGDGGQIIAWSDGDTYFYGTANARGGSADGDGGFVEVSGRQNLAFNGEVDVSASAGISGTLLLDPRDILISAASSELEDAALPTVSEGVSEGNSLGISASALTGRTGNVILEASNDIRVDEDVSLDLSASGGDITFTADSDRNGRGSFLMGNVTPETLEAPGESIKTSGGHLTISGASIVAGDIDTSQSNGPGGNVSLTSSIGNIIVGYIDTSITDNGQKGGDITINARRLFRATRPINPTPSNIEGDGGVSLYSAGNLKDSGSEGDNLLGGIININHGGDDFLVGVNGVIVTDPSDDDLVIRFSSNPFFSFVDDDSSSGTIGGIVSRNTNGRNRAIYQDSVIRSGGDFANPISVSRVSPNISDPTVETSSGELVATISDTEEDCEDFVSDGLLDVSSVAPDECQEEADSVEQ